MVVRWIGRAPPLASPRLSSLLSLASLVSSAAASTASRAALQLHVKAGPDGASVGDCPFAHALRICCAEKKLSVDVRPHSPVGKPQWLVDDHGGRMPALVSAAGEVVTESRVIAEWLEGHSPTPALLNVDGQQAAEEAAAPVFGAFARYCKSVGKTEEEERDLKKALLLSLCNLDAHLMGAAAPYVAGPALSMTDAFLLPVLYHIRVAGSAFKDFEIPYQFDALNQYMDLLEEEPVASTNPPEAMVVWGWANARGDAEAAAEAEAELKGKVK